MRASFFALVLVCTAFLGHSQTARLTDQTIVKDTSGMIYPAPVWKSLMNRHYKLVAENPKDPASHFIIQKMSDAEIDARMAHAPKPKESTAFVTGKKTKLFKVKDIEGNTIDLRDPKGKIIVMNFWFINCPPCKREIPDLNELVAEFGSDSNIIFVAVALDDKAALQQFVKTSPFRYQIVDNGRFFAQDYGVKYYPTHAIFDGEGKVYFHTSGLAHNTIYWIRKSIKELVEKRAAATAAR